MTELGHMTENKQATRRYNNDIKSPSQSLNSSSEVQLSSPVLDSRPHYQPDISSVTSYTSATLPVSVIKICITEFSYICRTASTAASSQAELCKTKPRRLNSGIINCAPQCPGQTPHPTEKTTSNTRQDWIIPCLVLCSLHFRHANMTSQKRPVDIPLRSHANITS